MEQKFIDFFRYKLAQGCYNSKVLPNFDTIQGFDKTSKKTINGLLDKLDQLTNILQDEGPLDFSSQITLHKELLWEYTSNTRTLFFSTDMIDFRFIENNKLSDPYILTIFNISNERIRLKWLIEKNIGVSNQSGVGANFLAMPEEAFIEKRSNLEFKIYFKPTKPEAYYFANLTCVGFFQNSINQKEKKDKFFF